MEVLLITGMSGAGKSQALKVFEDLGYYSMDNLPPMLLSQFAELSLNSEKGIQKAAIVIDTRGGIFFDDFFKGLKELEELDVKYKILYLDASDKVLVKRYKELRRPHPLNPEGSLTEGIALERERLQEVKKQAHYMINTSKLSNNQLRSELLDVFVEGKASQIPISIVSFGFKHGILIDGDLIFDVRFLPNPYYIEALRNKDGLVEETRDYIFSWPQTDVFIDKTLDLLEFLIPHYVEEGKSQLVIGIGCTGGFHRSVAISNELAHKLKTNGHRIILNHRDKDRR